MVYVFLMYFRWKKYSLSRDGRICIVSQPGQETSRKNCDLNLQGSFCTFHDNLKNLKRVKWLKSVENCNALLDIGWQRLKTKAV